MEGQSFEQIPPLAAAALGLIGLALGLFGYYLILTFARIEAALILGILAAAPGVAIGLWFVALPGLVAGLVVGFIFGRAYLKLQMAITGTAGGGAIGIVASLMTGLPWWILVPLGAILFGVLTFLFSRPILVIGTSAAGGILAGFCAGAGLHSAGLIDADQNKLPVAGLALAAWALCAFVQFRITSGTRLKPPPADPDPWSRVSRL